jgi:hypothetical protein
MAERSLASCPTNAPRVLRGGRGLRRAMCRWCVVMLILAVVGALTIYWRI